MGMSERQKGKEGCVYGMRWVWGTDSRENKLSVSLRRESLARLLCLRKTKENEAIRSQDSYFVSDVEKFKLRMIRVRKNTICAEKHDLCQKKEKFEREGQCFFRHKRQL